MYPLHARRRRARAAAAARPPDRRAQGGSAPGRRRVSNGTEASGGCARVPRGSWSSCGAAFSSAIEGDSAIGSSDAAGILYSRCFEVKLI
jgi:hypothetical protein